MQAFLQCQFVSTVCAFSVVSYSKIPNFALGRQLY